MSEANSAVAVAAVSRQLVNCRSGGKQHLPFNSAYLCRKLGCKPAEIFKWIGYWFPQRQREADAAAFVVRPDTSTAAHDGLLRVSEREHVKQVCSKRRPVRLGA